MKSFELFFHVSCVAFICLIFGEPVFYCAHRLRAWARARIDVEVWRWSKRRQAKALRRTWLRLAASNREFLS